MSIENLQLTVELTPQTDERGVLHVVERNGEKTAFGMERAFWITNVPTGAVRGEHANRECTELLVAVHGSVDVWLTDGQTEHCVRLDRPGLGLYIPPMVWCRLWNFSADATLLCLADRSYDKSQYINDFSAYIEEIHENRANG